MYILYIYVCIYIYIVHGGSGPLACVTLQSRKAAKAPDAAKPQSRKAAYGLRRRKAAKPLTDFDAAKPQSLEVL